MITDDELNKIAQAAADRVAQPIHDRVYDELRKHFGGAFSALMATMSEIFADMIAAGITDRKSICARITHYSEFCEPGSAKRNMFEALVEEINSRSRGAVQ